MLCLGEGPKSLPYITDLIDKGRSESNTSENKPRKQILLQVFVVH
jgi:hypothetical protein